MVSVKAASRAPSRRSLLLITLFAVALVILPFLFWYETWFGRTLSSDKIDEYLDNAQKPRRQQHALVQIGERLGRGEKSVRHWYPKVIELASSPSEELRQTVAWTMGQDPRHEPFRQALLGLLADPSPLVQRNAALSLAAFRDPAGRSVLRSMLRPALIDSPAAGSLKYRLEAGNYVNPGTLVARVGEVEVRSRLPGELRSLLEPDGAEVRTGQPLVELAADEKHVWEALRALYLVGAEEDLEEVERHARGVRGMPERIRQQARLTLRRIRERLPIAPGAR